MAPCVSLRERQQIPFLSRRRLTPLRHLGGVQTFDDGQHIFRMLAELRIHFADADAPLAIDNHIAHVRHVHTLPRHVILPNDAHGRVAEQWKC